MGILQTEYYKRYKVNASSFQYAFNQGRIGLAGYFLKQDGTESNRRIYVDRAPLTDAELETLPKYDEFGYLQHGLLGEAELRTRLSGRHRLSFYRLALVRYKQAYPDRVKSYTNFSHIMAEGMVFLDGLVEDYLADFVEFTSKSTDVETSEVLSGSIGSKRLTVDILSTYYPYSALYAGFESAGRLGDLPRVSADLFDLYLSQEGLEEVKGLVEKVYLEGHSIPSVAKEMGISRSALYQRFKKYGEQFVADSSQFLYQPPVSSKVEK